MISLLTQNPEKPVFSAWILPYIFLIFFFPEREPNGAIPELFLSCMNELLFPLISFMFLSHPFYRK